MNVSLRSVAGLLLLAASGRSQRLETEQIRINAPDVRSSETIVTAMLEFAKVKSTDTVYDLGSGDGRIVIAAAKQFGAHGAGIEISPDRVKEAQSNAKKAGVDTLVKFEIGDLFDSDIHAATVVTLYLLPDLNLRLRPKLLRELKPGTRVVSRDFDMGDWKPEKEQVIEGSHLYLWTIPPR
ncbi:MAG TPA: methyltransferase domain-containing protein [Bryobacteraceae bacterium]|nr:methyltransferase domain-containing protein [Bryobacteraceae bacterium]